jgi:hypothetical protein
VTEKLNYDISDLVQKYLKPRNYEQESRIFENLLLMNDDEKAPHMPIFKFVRKIMNGLPPS